MNDLTLKALRASIKEFSDERFDDMIKRNRDNGHLDEMFLNMLDKSVFFREVYCEAFLEGMTHEKSLTEKLKKEFR